MSFYNQVRYSLLVGNCFRVFLTRARPPVIVAAAVFMFLLRCTLNIKYIYKMLYQYNSVYNVIYIYADIYFLCFQVYNIMYMLCVSFSVCRLYIFCIQWYFFVVVVVNTDEHQSASTPLYCAVCLTFILLLLLYSINLILYKFCI